MGHNVPSFCVQMNLTRSLRLVHGNENSCFEESCLSTHWLDFWVQKFGGFIFRMLPFPEDVFYSGFLKIRNRAKMEGVSCVWYVLGVFYSDANSNYSSDVCDRLLDVLCLTGLVCLMLCERSIDRLDALDACEWCVWSILKRCITSRKIYSDHTGSELNETKIWVHAVLTM